MCHARPHCLAGLSTLGKGQPILCPERPIVAHRPGKGNGMPQTAGTVFKALGLLDAFLGGTTEFSLRELTAHSGLNKTTTLRLCATLEAAGFLEREAGSGYRLGPKIWQLAQTYRRGFRLEEQVRRQLQRLRDATEESVSFYVVDGDERLCRFRENSRLTVRHHLEEGAHFPLGSGVVGRVLLAFRGDGGDGDLPAIRKAGFLIGRGREAHTTSAAVPVRDAAGRLHGALVVSGPSMRFAGDAPKAALRLLLDAAAAIAPALPAPGGEEAPREVSASKVRAREPQPARGGRTGPGKPRAPREGTRPRTGG